MKFSLLAERFQRPLGMLDLMEDLGNALADGGDVAMLGGGNPSHIPAVEQRYAERMRALLEDPDDFGRLVGNYSPPRGEPRFLAALAGLLRSRCGLDVGPEHIVLTTGSQAAFFALVNAFAGPMPDGRHRHVLLPMVPEYIGYTDLGLAGDMFRAALPLIELLDDHEFRYRIDFDRLTITDDTGLICLSRPGNPTANMLSDADVARLQALARAHDVPLVLDCAYGLPFPGIVFTPASVCWDVNTVLCLSLSKLGLAAARTGIVVATPEIASLMARMNAIMCLAPGGIGPVLAHDLVASGAVIDLGAEVIRPWYEQRARAALQLLHEALHGLPYHVHRAEGGLFLWLWFPGLPITTLELYRRLKARGVVVVPGEHFFPGLRTPWRHRQECIRLTYAQPEDSVRRGVRALAEEVRRAGDKLPVEADSA